MPSLSWPGPGGPSRRSLSLLVVCLFVSSAVALVLHPTPERREAPPEEGSASQALADLATAQLLPTGPRPKAVAPTTGPTTSVEPLRRQAEAVARATRGQVGLPGLPLTAPAGAAAYRGLGTWVDVYDWSRTFTGGRPHVGPDAVDRMAEVGVQTLYIQASKHDAPGDVLEPDLLVAWIGRARARGIHVVAWYLPTLVDLGRDLQRLAAIGALPVDSVAVDIEARDVRDVGERNRRLVALSAAARRLLAGRTLGAIVLPPVVLEAVNPAYWSPFPYRQLASLYDVWLTMGYWTNRPSGTAYRDAYRYTAENVIRLRNNLGLPQAPVHPIGGIGNQTTVADVAGYRKAVTETSGMGGSLYDWRTTRAELWPAMQTFRA